MLYYFGSAGVLVSLGMLVCFYAFRLELANTGTRPARVDFITLWRAYRTVPNKPTALTAWWVLMCVFAAAVVVFFPLAVWEVIQVFK